jgi:Bacterial membrane protein YfhO
LGLAVPGIGRNANPYIGLALLALAFLAITVAWKNRVVRLLGTIGVASLLFTLAGYNVFHGVLYALVPMLDKARNPSAAIFIFHFCIVVLGAYAIDSYAALRTSLWLPRLYRFLLAFAVVLYLALLFRTLWSFQGGPDPDAVAVAALTAVLLAAALYAWVRGHLSPTTTYVLVFLLAMVEVGQFSSAEWRNQDQPGFIFKKIYQDGDVAAFIHHQKGPVRLEIDSTVIPYNFGDWYGIEVFGGYLASLTTNVYNAQNHYQGRMLAGANLYLGSKPSRANQSEVYSNWRGIHIYSNPEALPPVWTVHQVEAVSGSQAMDAHLNEPLDQLRNRAFVTAPAPVVQNCASQDHVELADHRINSLSVTADMQCKGLVIIGDTDYPGWQATVDGQSAPIYEAYGFLRGVVVDGGHHRIEMHYRPRSVYLGALLTGIGFLGLLAVWFGGSRLER